MTVSPITDSAGRIIGASKIARDITERKQNESALRLSNERFQIVARATNDAVWDWNLVTNALWWNEGFTTLFHYPPKDVEPDITSWTNRLHPQDLDRVKIAIYQPINAGGIHWSDEYHFHQRLQRGHYRTRTRPAAGTKFYPKNHARRWNCSKRCAAASTVDGLTPAAPVRF